MTEHLEDEVLNGGVVGTRGAISFLQSLRDMLAGHSTGRTVNLTTKWDGCVHEDTVVLTNNGDMTIKEIVNREDLWGELEIKGKNLQSPLQYDAFSLLLAGNASDGTKQWVEVMLDDGSVVKLTCDHEVHTARGWIKAGDLIYGDDVTEL